MHRSLSPSSLSLYSYEASGSGRGPDRDRGHNVGAATSPSLREALLDASSPRLIRILGRWRWRRWHVPCPRVQDLELGLERQGRESMSDLLCTPSCPPPPSPLISLALFGGGARARLLDSRPRVQAGDRDAERVAVRRACWRCLSVPNLHGQRGASAEAASRRRRHDSERCQCATDIGRSRWMARRQQSGCRHVAACRFAEADASALISPTWDQKLPRTEDPPVRTVRAPPAPT